MKRSQKAIVAILTVSLLFICGTVFAKKAEEMIKARFANIQLIVNGKTIQTKAEPFIYNGNVYAPLATIANMLGVKQEWDNSVPAVRFDDNLADEEITMGDRAAGVFLLDFQYALVYGAQTDTLGNTYYDLVNRKVPQSKIIHLPRIEKEGYINYFQPITPFERITGQEKNEFLMSERLSKQGEMQQWVSLFRFDKVKGTVTKWYSQRLDEPGDNYIGYSITGGSTLTVKLYEIQENRPKLAGVRFYQWMNGKYVKTEEVIQ
jgi:hypothetical protein